MWTGGFKIKAHEDGREKWRGKWGDLRGERVGGSDQSNTCKHEICKPNFWNVSQEKKMTVSNESFRWGIFCLSLLLVLEEKNLPSLCLWMSAEKRLHIGHWDSNLGCQLDPSGKGKLRCGAASIGLACWKPGVYAAVV